MKGPGTRLARLGLASLGLACLTGCETPSRFHWGHYEQSILRTASLSAEFDPAEEIEQLEQDMLEADKRGKPLPPGFRAHLGWLHSQVDDPHRARELFEGERREWPQSEALMAMLLDNLDAVQLGAQQ